MTEISRFICDPLNRNLMIAGVFASWLFIIVTPTLYFSVFWLAPAGKLTPPVASVICVTVGLPVGAPFLLTLRSLLGVRSRRSDDALNNS